MFLLSGLVCCRRLTVNVAVPGERIAAITAAAAAVTAVAVAGVVAAATAVVAAVTTAAAMVAMAFGMVRVAEAETLMTQSAARTIRGVTTFPPPSGGWEADVGRREAVAARTPLTAHVTWQ